MRISRFSLLTNVCLTCGCMLLVMACSRQKREVTPPEVSVEPIQSPPAPGIRLGEAPRMPEESK
jgi:hypothetical protein